MNPDNCVHSICGQAQSQLLPVSCSTYQTKQGHHEHRVMKNASFTPTECCLSCLAAHAVFWHDASSFGRWETRNTSTSLCHTPSSQGEALWWHSWQWQTDNGWMLHFTFLTFLWKCLPPLLCWVGEKQSKKVEHGKKKHISLQGLFHEDAYLEMMLQVSLQHVAQGHIIYDLTG